MKWPHLLKVTANQPIFRTQFLLVGNQIPSMFSKQICLWVKAGRLEKIRKGWYAVKKPYRKESIDPYYLATTIKQAAYVSLQSALYFYGLIPEYVPTVTCVTTGRPEKLNTSFARILYKHIKPELFFGYQELKITDNQTALIATPEKALCDLIYLTTRGGDQSLINELRLQHLSIVNGDVLMDIANSFGGRKILKAAKVILKKKKEDEEHVAL